MKVHPFWQGVGFGLMAIVAGLVFAIALCWFMYGVIKAMPYIVHVFGWVGMLFPPNPWFE